MEVGDEVDMRLVCICTCACVCKQGKPRGKLLEVWAEGCE